jgi:hypothetical protein
MLTTKRAVLVDLVKGLGMFIERREQGGAGDFRNMLMNNVTFLADRPADRRASTSFT